MTTTAKYREWDVTAEAVSALPQGLTKVSIGMHMNTSITNSPDSFNSREASSNQPVLVITP